MLAFKNDIGFWRRTRHGGSERPDVIFNAGCQLVIFLYLLDNETSWMVNVAAPGSDHRGVEDYQSDGRVDQPARGRSRTSLRVHQERHRAPRRGCHAVPLLRPLPSGGLLRSLQRDLQRHRGWYSFALNTLVGAVYLFGFITMCPQLYINYKLKSVAHLPWRQMTYKFLNTIIDDLFAFVIKMPTMHRLSVFRDDIVFLIFLYQRRIYRVDKTRVNEFGFSGEAPPDAIDEQKEDEDKEERRTSRVSSRRYDPVQDFDVPQLGQESS